LRTQRANARPKESLHKGTPGTQRSQETNKRKNLGVFCAATKDAYRLTERPMKIPKGNWNLQEDRVKRPSQGARREKWTPTRKDETEETKLRKKDTNRTKNAAIRPKKRKIRKRL